MSKKIEMKPKPAKKLKSPKKKKEKIMGAGLDSDNALAFNLASKPPVKKFGNIAAEDDDGFGNLP